MDSALRGSTTCSDLVSKVRIRFHAPSTSIYNLEVDDTGE